MWTGIFQVSKLGKLRKVNMNYDVLKTKIEKLINT